MADQKAAGFKRLTKTAQVELVENRANGVRAQLERMPVDYATLDAFAAVEDPELIAEQRKTLDQFKARLEGQVGKLDSKANALRGKPLSKQEKDERDQRVADQAVAELEQLVGSWEPNRMQHLLNAEVGVDPNGQPVDSDKEQQQANLIKVRVDAAVAEIDRLKT